MSFLPPKMQSYRSEYSSSEYYSSHMSGGGHDYEYGAHNMMMAGGGRKQAQHRYMESQALSNYGMDHCGMNRAGRYGEYGQAYNSTGSVVPYSAGVDHVNSTQYQMSKANTLYGSGYGGGHYLAKQKQQQQRMQYSGMEYNTMNQQQMHHQKRSEKRMARKMNAMSMSSGSCTTSRGINDNKDNYSDSDEYCTGSDSDDDDNIGGNHCEDYDSGSDYERRRNYSRPIY